MFTLDHRLRPHPDAVNTELDTNKLVLPQMRSKTYYSLNLPGLRVWQRVRKGSL
jgi:hypothetical protein